MEKFRNIPNFRVEMNKKSLFVNFENKIDGTDGLEIKADNSDVIAITTINNKKLFSISNNNSYNLMDGLRDSLLLLSGNHAEFVNHNNILDQEYLEEVRPNGQPTKLVFEVKFNPPEKRIKKPQKPFYYVSPVIYTSYGKTTRKTEKKFSIDEPDLYLLFDNNVKIYTQYINGLSYIISKNFGIHINKENEPFTEFKVFSYNEYLEKGLCIFEKQANSSFFDLYDIFDVMNILLSCASINNDLDETFDIAEYSYYDGELPIEL